MLAKTLWNDKRERRRAIFQVSVNIVHARDIRCDREVTGIRKALNEVTAFRAVILIAHNKWYGVHIEIDRVAKEQKLRDGADEHNADDAPVAAQLQELLAEHVEQYSHDRNIVLRSLNQLSVIMRVAK